jgi:hypothetical protein
MLRRTLALTLLALYLALNVQPVVAAPGPNPPGPTPMPCSWRGQVYPHGSTRHSPVIGPLGNIIRYDIYRCQDASWVYIGSSDDVN